MNTKQLIKHLRKLGNGEIKPINKGYGVCSELSVCKIATGDAEKVYKILVAWPEGTGSAGYPVPHKNLTGFGAYDRQDIPMWDRRTQYGKARARLCLYIAQELEKEL